MVSPVSTQCFVLGGSDQPVDGLRTDVFSFYIPGSVLNYSYELNYLILTIHCAVGAIVIPILQMNKMRHRDTKRLVRGHALQNVYVYCIDM